MKPEVTLLAAILMAVVSGSERFESPIELMALRDMSEWQPEANQTCAIGPEAVLAACRTLRNGAVECKVSANVDRKWVDDVRLASLPVSQRKLLMGLASLLNGSEDGACAVERMETLDLRNSGLTFVGGGQRCEEVRCASQLQSLFMAGSGLERLESASFCAFEQLQNLVLEDSALYELHEETFAHLESLWYLSLAGNQLTSLPVNLFRNNTELAYLFLDRNKLSAQALPALRPLTNLNHVSMEDNLIDSVDYDTSILNDTNRLLSLLVSNNRIRKLSTTLLPLSELRYLNASNNSVSHVVSNAFHGMKSIIGIDLSDNLLRTLSNETFARNKKLEILILRNNRLIDFPKIDSLTSLKTFVVNDNRLESIKKSDLMNCKSLETLNISNNRIESIEIGAFDAIDTLEALDLSGNRLTGCSLVFRKSVIRMLNLDRNSLTDFSFADLPNDIISISIRYNRIDSLRSEGADRKWALRNILLSHNRLTQLDDDFRLPPKTEVLDLGANMLTGWGPSEGGGPTKLKVVDLSHNKLSVVCYRALLNFRSPNRVRYLLSGNPLTCSCENKWIKQWSDTEEYVISDFDDLTCTSGPEEEVRFKEFDRFRCGSNDDCQCPSGPYFRCARTAPNPCHVVSNRKLSIISYDCRNRNLSRLPEAPYFRSDQATPLVAIDLTGNDLKTIKREFGNLTTLRTLVLASSNIGSIEFDAFYDLINLRTLNLSSNSLKELPAEVFKSSPELELLDLSLNLLKSVENGTFVHLQWLRALNLSGNRLTTLPVDDFRNLGSMSNLVLHDNPWTCACAFVEDFRNFLANSTHVVQSPNELYCVDNRLTFNLLSFDMSLCKTLLHVTALATSMTFALVLIVAAILFFVYRREMQVLVYARYGLRVFHKKQPEAEVENKQYDAFIAYSSDDVDFLFHELLPMLEGIERPFRLCIHERDFPAGSYIQDSIIEAIRLSSRTIVILTENFTRSGWCRFEFKSAHVQMLEDRCPRVLVIVVGEIPQSLDPEMQLYLKTNTYLQWGEKLFWEKLYYAMPDLRVTSPPTDIMPMRLI